MVRFLAQETASGLLLLVAAAAALIWANSPFSDGYHHFWETEIELAIGSWTPLLLDGHALSLGLVVNDVLMVLFFFVVGLEIKAELVTGDLSSPKDAALPALAAVGGMAVPAAIYALINIGSEGISGWGVPMATDIAFAVGVMALLGPRVPSRLKLFLLALAIADDVGAIVVIAVFYSEGLSLGWLAAAIGGLGVVIAMQRSRMWFTPMYVIVGVIIWYATFRSGVHATIAGVALGLLAPARPLLGAKASERIRSVFSGESASPMELRDASWRIRESAPVTSRLIRLLSPWTSFLVIPIFALANAGVTLTGDAASAAARSNVTLGVIVGLVVGKPLGILLTTILATRFTSIELPDGVTPRHVLGAGAVAGIGFTVALFIGTLGFDDPALGEQATIGVLIASVTSAVIGFCILRGTKGPSPMPDMHEVKA